MRYHTIREIADTVGVSKVNGYQHYQRLKRSRGAKFTKHVKFNNKILLDNYSYNLMLKSFKKVNSNQSVTLVKSYQARITDLEREVKSLTQDKQQLYTALARSQKLERTAQLKIAQPTVKNRGKKRGFIAKLKNFFK